MSKQGRFVLVSGALVFFVWANIAMTMWLRQHSSLTQAIAHFRTSMFADWLLFLMLTDAAVFTMLALGWLARDMRRRRLPWVSWWGWMGATILLGCPGLLLYLALHPDRLPVRSTGPVESTRHSSGS